MRSRIKRATKVVYKIAKDRDLAIRSALELKSRGTYFPSERVSDKVKKLSIEQTLVQITEFDSKPLPESEKVNMKYYIILRSYTLARRPPAIIFKNSKKLLKRIAK